MSAGTCAITHCHNSIMSKDTSRTLVESMDQDLSPSNAQGLIIGGSVVGGGIVLVLLVICCCCRVRLRKSGNDATRRPAQKLDGSKNETVTSFRNTEGNENKNDGGSLDVSETPDFSEKKVRFSCEGEGKDQKSNTPPVAVTNLPPYAKIRKDTTSDFYSNTAHQ